MKFKLKKIFPFFHKKAEAKNEAEPTRKELVIELVMPEDEGFEDTPKTAPIRSVSTTCSVSIPPTNIEEAINRCDEKIEKIDTELNNDSLSERNRTLRSSQKQILQKAKNDLEIVQKIEKIETKKVTENPEKSAKNSNFIRRSLRRVSKGLRKRKNKHQEPEKEAEKEPEVDLELENLEIDTTIQIEVAKDAIENAGKLTKSLESLHTKIEKDSRKI